MKYLSLFSGIGGFELGIQQAYEQSESNRALGNREQSAETADLRQELYITDSPSELGNRRGKCAECIGYSEIDKYATQIYQSHFNHKNYGDITKINAEELPDFDFLCGGFPCQSFSIAGKRGGFNDTRGTLFFDIARILKIKHPRLLLLENVKGLLSHDEGRTFRTIISTLDELGYDLQWQVLNSKNFGVPQNRERVFIVGHLRGTSRPEVFPIGGQNTTTAETIFLDESQWRREGKLREYQGVSPTLNTVGGGGHLPLTTDKIKIRRLTPTECERLQGFPDGWTEGVSDTQRYKTLGNAVTVNVIQAIMEKILL
jgi:DNA (cytosine-5)-methyltransferase 1